MKLIDLKDGEGEFKRTIEYCHTKLVQDKFVATFLEKVFATRIHVAYVSRAINPTKGSINITSSTVVLVNANDKVVVLSNSEWCDIYLL